jgi:hypothetical protein
MKKKMVTAALLVLLAIAAMLAYPVLRIRWAPLCLPSPARRRAQCARKKLVDMPRRSPYLSASRYGAHPLNFNSGR